jgi:uncharacterized repeat protein (TIGR01451 family)
MESTKLTASLRPRTLIGSMAIAVGALGLMGVTQAPAKVSSSAPFPTSPDLRVSGQDRPDPVHQGDPLTYSLTVTNRAVPTTSGVTDATGVTINDVLPTGATFVSASPGCSYSAGTVTCSVGDLDARASVRRTIVARPTQAGTAEATASVTSVEADANPADNTSRQDTVVLASGPSTPDLSLTMVDAPDPVAQNANLTYTLTASNRRTAVNRNDATGVVVADTLPAGVQFVSASSGCSYSAGAVTCAIGNLNGGATARRQIVVRPTQTGTVFNRATVTANESDPNPGNNIANEDTDVRAAPAVAANLSVSVKDSPDPVASGSNLTYTVTTTNSGPSTATGVMLTDNLPSGVTFVSASPACSASGSTVTCALGSLSRGGRVVDQIVVRPNSSGKIRNQVSVRANERDPSSSNNSRYVDTTVTGARPAPPPPASADLGVSVSDSPNPAHRGRTLTYKIMVANAGPNAATGVTLSSQLQGAFRFLSASPGCTEVNGLVTCRIGTLAPNETRVLRAIVRPTRPGRLSDATTISGAEVDANSANNADTERTAVLRSKRPRHGR